MDKRGIAIVTLSEEARELAQLLKRELQEADLYSTKEQEGFTYLENLQTGSGELMARYQLIIYFSAMGICVRSIAPYLVNKYLDPAVLCIDTTGKYVISVVSGHVGGANDWSKRVAAIIGAEPIITTQSDRLELWALDTLGKSHDWKNEPVGASLNDIIALFVHKEPTALLLDIRTKGTAWLERSKPDHVDIYWNISDIDWSKYKLFIAVTYIEYKDIPIPQLYYRPQVLHLGIGCRKDAIPTGVAEHILEEIRRFGYSTKSIAGVHSIELKKDEALIADVASKLGVKRSFYSSERLAEIEVPNPSAKVEQVTSSASVSEASALYASGGTLLVEKQKGALVQGSDFTFALAMEPVGTKGGHIEIVGAGPGDPELVSVRGKQFLQRADLILYAGSLVPIELTYYAKEGATVRSSADMALEEQFELMKEFYDRNCLVVRLHTGDPAIFGAIQEQMALFDEAGMSYHITPGISSFQAAAAELQSQFTIPEKVQTIILTRGEGRTPMPDREQLHKLAASQSTMCIFLSASIAEKVQEELLVHYPPTTPVAVCYKLTWKDQKIWRGELQHLAQIVRENKLTLTTLIVVGEAIDNRKGLSKLYADEFKHLFRK
ncbi:precorrin-4 C(11)-methyltransferase [Porphyromonas levii]|uniref:precorrin-4 C(11)-methyltransferase n=1 Tax=Porphyromonas levii TaxID=28114 RepID=UPI001B8C452B|nr:precorrin-4 C(11)-methyltransferase [Porphyromonas levii]MBR8713120.1 Siroheme synthase [Porphyromonas levii]MBR8715167.1 Siroheme synthase [Porphyromonas levii]MBR8727642.1 Siroheme synthase [Porphyromonas levii]MBR8729270.1 Siroheme synthase [Porphyromonas levii]MBR8731344.1 Siroheme synthase [Porphyromonas levii]